MRDFSTFWLFSVKPIDAERVFRSATMVVGAREPAGGCDSKTAHKNMLFSCPVLGASGGCNANELAVVSSVHQQTM
jgi:hypothetical protein